MRAPSRQQREHKREPRRCDHRTLAVLHILPAAAAPPPTSHTTSRRRAAASLPHARLLLRKRDALAGDEDAEEGDARDEDGALPLVFLEVGLRGRQSERESGRGSAGGSDTGRIKSGEWEEEPQSSSSRRLENGFLFCARRTWNMKVGLLAWPPPPMPAPMPRDATRCDSFASAELLHSRENKKRRQSVRGAYAVLGLEKRLCG